MLLMTLMSIPAWGSGSGCTGSRNASPLSHPRPIQRTAPFPVRYAGSITLSFATASDHFGKIILSQTRYVDGENRDYLFTNLVRSSRLAPLIDFLPRFHDQGKHAGIPPIPATLTLQGGEYAVFDDDSCSYTGEIRVGCAFSLEVPSLPASNPTYHGEGISGDYPTVQACEVQFQKLVEGR